MPGFKGVGRRIADARTRRLLTQEQLAEAAGLNVRTIQRAERDRLGIASLHAIARALEIEVDELAGPPRSSSPTSGVIRDSRHAVSDYILALQARYADVRTPLVFPSLAGRPRVESIGDLVNLLQARDVVQVVGAGGMGKSLLLTHALERMLELGCLPVMVSARTYDGDLARTLDEAVAAFTSAPGTDLLDAREAETRLVVLVDGVNECRDALVPRLCDDLAALRHRRRAALLISSRAVVSALGGCVQSVAPYGSAQRAEILRSHTPAAIPRIDDALFSVLATPLDLRLAARCHTELTHAPTPYEIRLAFVRQTLRERVRTQAVAFEGLIQIARTMTAKVDQVLPLSEIIHIVGKIAEPATEGFTTVDDLLETGLLEHNHGRCGFSHELFLEFFHTLALLRDAHGNPALCAVLRSPRNARCRAMAAQAVQEQPDLLDLLDRLEDSDIVGLALAGGLGRVAERRIRREVATTIRKAEAAAAELRLDAASGSIFFAKSTKDQDWSWLEREIFRQVGRASLVDLEMQALARRVIASTDRALVHLADRLRTYPYSPKGVTYRSVYLFQSAGQLPVTDVLHGVRPCAPPAARVEAIEFARHPDGLGWGELRYALDVWRCLSDPKEVEDPTSLLLGLLDACWATGIGNLRMDALEASPTHAAHLGTSHTEAVIAWLEAREDANDLMLGPSVLHALGELGAFADVDAHEIRDVLCLALARPHTEDGRAAAYRFVSGMLDHPVLSEKYCEAEDGLSESDARTLYAAAVLGAPEDGLFLSFAIRQLAKRAGLAGDMLATEALLKHARPPVATGILPDQPVSAYAHCLRGLAMAGLPPPTPSGPTGDLEALWFAYGRIIHSVAGSHNACRDDVESAWQHVLGMPAAIAVAPLAWLEVARQFGETSIVGPIVARHPKEVRQLVEGALPVLDELVDLYAERAFGARWREHHLARLQGFVVTLAGEVGDHATRDALRGWVDFTTNRQCSGGFDWPHR